MIEVATSELRHSPLTFEWNDDTMTQKSNHGDFDPFSESNENSLASDDHSEFSRVAKPSLRIDVDENSESGGASRRKRRSTTPSSDLGGAISRRKKKPKGMPKRPLSAYNFFFHYVRSKILETAESSSERIGFEGMAKIIGKQWQALSAEDRKEFEELAENDTVRYRKEMESYNEVRAKKSEEGERNSSAAPVAEAVLEHGSFNAHARPYDESDVFMPHSTLPTQQHDLFMTGPSAHSISISSREEFSRLHALTAPSGTSPYNAEIQHQMSDPGPSESMSPPLYRFRHDEAYHSGIGPMGMHQVVVPPPPANAEPVPPPSSFHMPPGMEIVLSDRTGQDRKYRVQYNCYSMTRDAARNYIDGWTGTASRDRGALPATQQYHPMQMQMHFGSMQTHRGPPPTNSAWMPF